MTLIEGILLFKAEEVIWCIMEAGTVFILSKKRVRFVFIYFLSRCFLFLFSMTLISGKIVSGIIYVSFENRSWFLIVLFLIFLDILLLYDKRSHFYCKELQYPITIRTNNHCLQLIGYLDTGNKCTNFNIPIIVLNENYIGYFDDTDMKELWIGSVNLISNQKAYLCELSVENGVYQRVWAIFSDQLADIDCLLNIHNI